MRDIFDLLRALRSAALVVLALTGFAASMPAQAQLFRAAERAAARVVTREAAEKAATRAATRRATNRSAGEIAIQRGGRKAADNLVNRWTLSLCKPARTCPLPESHAATFTGGSYREVRLGSDTILYRNYSSQDLRLGVPGERYSYWSRSNARGTQAVIDSAIPVTRNGNWAEKQVSILVPRGTTIYEGTARSLPRGSVGGGNQIILDGVRPDWAVKR